MQDNYFEKLYRINVNGYVEEKNGLKYCSWSYVWAEIKKAHPDANYTIYENKDGWNYFTDGKTGWVKTGVTVNGIEHIEYLPIMDYKNKSILAENITSFDVNKTIQRSLTKACARHGLGLYIYAGEDLPEEEKEPEKTPSEKAKETRELNKLKDEELNEKAAVALKFIEENKSRELTIKEKERFEWLLREMTGRKACEELGNQLAKAYADLDKMPDSF